MKRFVCISVIICLLLMLCACGSSASPAETPVPTPDVTASPTPEPTPQPVDGLKDDGKIHVYLIGEGEVINTSDSSWIDALIYYAENEHLVLETNGSEYVFANVSEELWDEFKNAESKGEFYNQYFRGAEEYWVNDYDGSNGDLIIMEYTG